MSFGGTPVRGTAGWFDDPETPGISRYWDGQGWTERWFGEPVRYAPVPTTGGKRPLGPQYPQGYVPSTQRGPLPGAPTDSGAIWALVLACIGCLWGIPAIVMGSRARQRIKYSGGRLAGEGLATAATIIGWITFAFSIAVVVFVIAVGVTSEPTYTPPP